MIDIENVNKFEIALAITKRNCNICNIKNNMTCNSCVQQEVIAALEKQLPKQVTNHGRDLPEGTAYCSSCGAFLSTHHKYCFNCGQALEAQG